MAGNSLQSTDVTLDMNVDFVSEFSLSRSLTGSVDTLLRDEALGCPERIRLLIRLGLEETIVNAIKHGNYENEKNPSPEQRSRKVRLKVKIEETDPTDVIVRRLVNGHERVEKKEGCNRRVTIEVEDEGNGFHPENVPDPTADEHLEDDHGRGILLMKSLLDEVQHKGRGNVVAFVMAFRAELSEQVFDIKPPLADPLADTVILRADETTVLGAQ